MKKSILGVCLTLAMVMSTVCSAFAANNDYITLADGTRRLTYVSLADVNRITEIASKTRQADDSDPLLPQEYRSARKADSTNQARIINAQRLNNTDWVIRLAYTDGDYCESDFYVSTLDYRYDRDAAKIVSLPFEDNKDGLKWATSNLYGPCWYYVGVYSSKDPNTVAGLLLFQRINERRWPARADLNYSGTTGISQGTFKSVTGRYSQPCADNFFDMNRDR